MFHVSIYKLKNTSLVKIIVNFDLVANNHYTNVIFNLNRRLIFKKNCALFFNRGLFLL